MTAVRTISLDMPPGDVPVSASSIPNRIGRGQAGPVPAPPNGAHPAPPHAGSATAAAMAIPWVCVHHRADDGARVRLAIRREGGEVHWPRCIVRKPRQDDVLRPLFPGYLFARLANWGVIRGIPNVISIVGMRERGLPARVPDGLVEALIFEAGSIDGVIDLTPDATLKPWKRGDRLRVVSGPMAGLLVEFVRHGARDSVEVLLDYLGCVRAARMPREALAEPVTEGASP